MNVGFQDRRLDTNSTDGRVARQPRRAQRAAGELPRLVLGSPVHVDSTATVSAGNADAAGRGPRVRRARGGPRTRAGRHRFNPASGEVIPGQNQTTFPFDNFQISDIASNWDYTFRAGLFGGDYSGNAPVETEWHGRRSTRLWTDARNGRGSGGPTNLQPGRNPICEQSDVFFDRYNSKSGGKPKGKATKGLDYSSTPCPTDIKDKSSGDH